MTGMTTWHEERRQDQLVRAQIERDRDAARAQLRLTERREAAKLQREERQARTSGRQQARKVRAARRAARTAWLRGHTVDLLFVPVIAVPAVLAWTAMAAYGSRIYGPAGLALPAFSEGAMWAFAAATTLTRRQYPGRPLWHLRAGTVVFAGVGAALNFAHAVTSIPGGPPPAGTVTGVVYAVVSVAGVTVHQMVTAGPRRSRADRDAARLARSAARRQDAARRAALRGAVADVDEHGNARLVFDPGVSEVARRWGRTRLTPAEGHRAPLPAGPACAWPRPAPVLTPVPDAPESVRPAVAETRGKRPADATADASAGPAVTRQPGRHGRVSKAAAGRVRAERVIRENPQMSRADQAKKARVSESTIDRVKRDMADAGTGRPPRQLHAVGK